MCLLVTSHREEATFSEYLRLFYFTFTVHITLLRKSFNSSVRMLVYICTGSVDIFGTGINSTSQDMLILIAVIKSIKLGRTVWYPYKAHKIHQF